MNVARAPHETYSTLVIRPDNMEVSCDSAVEYSKIYHVKIRDRAFISEVRKKVRNVEGKLGLNIFSTE
ncbi:MAG: hypothetical protein PHS80_01720 [Methanothrix sp.]|nr:hypothetical protein [Methanothrix sp.]MDD4446216.1 hypothetical protein [Methanothrix sp.]